MYMIHTHVYVYTYKCVCIYVHMYMCTIKVIICICIYCVCGFCSGYIQAEAAGGWALQGSKGDYIIHVIVSVCVCTYIF